MIPLSDPLRGAHNLSLLARLTKHPSRPAVAIRSRWGAVRSNMSCHRVDVFRQQSVGHAGRSLLPFEYTRFYYDGRYRRYSLSR